jgi:hypothetical protein
MAKYSIDTSAILDAWVRYYPYDLFPSFWNKFMLSIQSKDCIAAELIEQELKRKDDGCIKWFQQNNLTDFFVPLDDKIQENAIQILKNPNYQRLVGDHKGSYGADPFVIALAQVNNLIVVTGERASNNIAKPKIPDVCSALGIESINILDLMRRERWQF